MEFVDWRQRARALLRGEVPPDAVHWSEGAQGSLLGDANDAEVPARDAPVARVPARLFVLLEDAFCHRSDRRLALMYRVLWRVTHGEPELVGDRLDHDMRALLDMQRQVEHDTHKMHAFVRFRELRLADAAAAWIAWHEPQHRVLRRAAPFFVDRFGAMTWTIATPDGIAAWNGTSIEFLPPDPQLRAPDADAKEALWLAYYAAIFNPARLNVDALCRHMPQRYWSTLPEARAIPALVASAAERAGRMLSEEPRPARPARAPVVPGAAALPDALDRCRRCPLWERATQGVPGLGPREATIMLVGEQPGDQEDLQGKPFVGPAGQLLRDALAAARLDASAVYLTNAVKHFGWEPRGKRRIHKTPGQRIVEACRPWLEAEIARVAPRVIVALGGTALLALTGERLAVATARAEFERRHAGGALLVATYHPSALLRADESRREELLHALVADLRRASAAAGVAGASPVSGALRANVTRASEEEREHE